MSPARRWRHSVFVAYSRVDDDTHGSWVRNFAAELELSLKAQLRGIDVPPLHLGEVGDRTGRAERVPASCAYLACVGDRFCGSLDELFDDLRVFERAAAGDARLHAFRVAMTEPAMQTNDRLVGASPRLDAVLPEWRPFFDPNRPDRPLPVYLSPGRLMAPAFAVPFGGLARDLAGRVRARLAARQGPPSAVASGAATVFISHASADLEWARAVTDHLEAAGLRCWLAARDIVPGSPSYPAEIAKALRASRALVVVVSREAGASPHVAREVTLADESGLPLLPLRLDGEPLGDALAYSLAGAQMVLAHGGPRDAALAALLAALRLRLGR